MGVFLLHAPRIRKLEPDTGADSTGKDALLFALLAGSFSMAKHGRKKQLWNPCVYRVRSAGGWWAMDGGGWWMVDDGMTESL